MLTKLVDLTYLCVLKEIYYVAESEEYRGNLILQDSDYKQQLIEYVLDLLLYKKPCNERQRKLSPTL